MNRMNEMDPFSIDPSYIVPLGSSRAGNNVQQLQQYQQQRHLSIPRKTTPAERQRQQGCQLHHARAGNKLMASATKSWPHMEHLRAARRVRYDEGRGRSRSPMRATTVDTARFGGRQGRTCSCRASHNYAQQQQQQRGVYRDHLALQHRRRLLDVQPRQQQPQYQSTMHHGSAMRGQQQEGREIKVNVQISK